MLVWTIITVVVLLFTILFIVMASNDVFYMDELWFALSMIFGFITVILIMVVTINFFRIPKEINSFENYQEIIDIAYQTDDDNVKVAMATEVIEMNQWLADARASVDTYGVFSMYYGKIEDLEYLEIE